MVFNLQQDIAKGLVQRESTPGTTALPGKQVQVGRAAYTLLGRSYSALGSQMMTDELLKESTLAEVTFKITLNLRLCNVTSPL